MKRIMSASKAVLKSDSRIAHASVYSRTKILGGETNVTVGIRSFVDPDENHSLSLRSRRKERRAVFTVVYEIPTFSRLGVMVLEMVLNRRICLHG